MLYMLTIGSWILEKPPKNAFYWVLDHAGLAGEGCGEVDFDKMKVIYTLSIFFFFGADSEAFIHYY